MNWILFLRLALAWSALVGLATAVESYDPIGSFNMKNKRADLWKVSALAFGAGLVAAVAIAIKP